MGKKRGHAKVKGKVDDKGLDPEIEKEIFDSLDIGVIETIREDLSIVQVNMGKRHDMDHLESYFGEKRFKADVLLVQEPPLCWDGKGVLGIRGFNAFYWIKDEKVDKDKIVSDLVKVKGCRKTRGGKKTLKERMVAKCSSKLPAKIEVKKKRKNKKRKKSSDDNSSELLKDDGEVSELLLEVSVGKNKVRKSRKGSEKRKRKSVGGGKRRQGKWKVDEVKSGLNEGKANVMGNGDHVRTCVCQE